MATPGQNARRRAQSRLARELRAGTYQRGPAGRAYVHALARITGSPIEGRMGEAGWRASQHSTLGAARRHAASLPPDAHVLISARGRKGYGADEGRRTWVTLHPAAVPDWYTQERQDQLAGAEDALIEGRASRYAVTWVIR